MSSLSLIPEEDKLRHLPSCINASKSLESLHSAFTISTKKSTSSGGTRRRRSEHTNSVLSRPPISNNEIRQRVMSARVQRVKVLQNQLIDAQHHITELDNENRILRKLHKRQDSALSRYENCSAELPQLLNSHSEEIRMWQTKYKNVQCQNRELTHKLKLKDTALFEMMDKNKHLESLSKDKNLEDREKLTDRVKFMEQKMADKEQEVKVLNRRLQLESKNFRTQICNEQQKYKDLLAKYQKTSLLPSERLSEPKSNSSMLFRSKNRLKTRLVQQKALATNESLSSPSVTSVNTASD